VDNIHVAHRALTTPERLTRAEWLRGLPTFQQALLLPSAGSGNFNNDHKPARAGAAFSSSDRAIRQHQEGTTTDARWVHFKPSRWGQCKSSDPASDQKWTIFRYEAASRVTIERMTGPGALERVGRTEERSDLAGAGEPLSLLEPLLRDVAEALA
jgi:hypothetical protein